MLKIRMMFFAFITLLIGTVQAQDTTVSKEWSIEAGFQNFRTYDKNTSPLIYVANNGYVGLQMLRKKTCGNWWSLSASIAVGSNQAKRFGQRNITTITHYDIFGEPDSIEYVINPLLSFVGASLGFSYVGSLTQTIYLGGNLHDNFYYGALGADVWFFNQLSLSPVIEKRWLNGNKHKLNTEISTPVLSYIVRQPYTLDPSLPIPNYFLMYLKTGSSLATFNKFQQINLSVHYNYLLNEKNKIGLVYKFMWLNSADYKHRNLRSYSNTFCLTYTF